MDLHHWHTDFQSAALLTELHPQKNWIMWESNSLIPHLSIVGFRWGPSVRMTHHKLKSLQLPYVLLIELYSINDTSFSTSTTCPSVTVSLLIVCIQFSWLIVPTPKFALRRKLFMSQPGIEPGTPILKGLCSNQLSYWPVVLHILYMKNQQKVQKILVRSSVFTVGFIAVSVVSNSS